MEFSITYDDKVFELTATGSASAGDYQNLLAAIVAHKEWQPGSLVLSDETAVQASELKTEDVREIAESCAQHAAIIGQAKFAILARADDVFGLNRMWEVYVGEKWNAQVMVFRLREQALEWLLS